MASFVEESMTSICVGSQTEDRLILPFEDASEWSRIESILCRPIESLIDIDGILTEFALGFTDQTCHFFTNISNHEDGSSFDFTSFWTYGVPLMIELALEMPKLFEESPLPLLLKGTNTSVTLTRRQCACLLAHSFFGSITSKAQQVNKEKWAFRAAQLFFLEAIPSALCFLNYFKILGVSGIPDDSVTYERNGFISLDPKRKPPYETPWTWQENASLLIPIIFPPEDAAIENCPAEIHADFANRFVGGGCLEADFCMEEILFLTKPELIVAMALNSYLHDEEVVRIYGALQFSAYSGYASTFEFVGDYCGLSGRYCSVAPPVVVVMDALHGAKNRQFEQGLVLRDLNKVRLAFDKSRGKAIATGNWGCGAFGNDHVLKFLQQWIAASDAGADVLWYHTRGDPRAAILPSLYEAIYPLAGDNCDSGMKKIWTVGMLVELMLAAAKEAAEAFPPPLQKNKFLQYVQEQVSID
jgi:poly(ADP-ribose) glycohydrolase